MPCSRRLPRPRWLLAAFLAAAARAAEPGLLFHVSGDHGTTAEVAAPGTAQPTFDFEVTPIADGAKGGALSCGDTQRLAWRAPGNIYAQRGTLSFFWRSRYPVGPTEFPIFRVAYADHSSWDMVWLRIDYNGHGFDAFVTDRSLSRTRVSVTLPEFPKPDQWTHLALAWDETRGIRFYVNGRLAAENQATAVYDAALDQFGPHSRIISPHNVQSDYNFVRGGDIDEIRIYDHLLPDAAVATLAQGAAPGLPAPAARTLADAATRAEWLHRYGWDRGRPPALPAFLTTVRKVQITDAYDLKRWWWKATDGIPETTWPGVYNRSRLPGRHDYFTLPDWDCYVDSGKAITFALPDEPWNQVEIAGAAWGKWELLPADTPLETASEAPAGRPLFERTRGADRSTNVVTGEPVGGRLRFTNAEQEQPINEISVYHVTTGREPAGREKLEWVLQPTPAPKDAAGVAPLERLIADRYPAEERARLYAGGTPDAAAGPAAPGLPIVHVLIPDTWDERSDGLDGLALELPVLATREHDLALNIRVHDPLWPLRDLCDFSFTVKPGQSHTLWLDLRDRLLPPGKALFLTIAGSGEEFDASRLAGTKLRLVFKPRESARPEHELDRFTQARDAYAMLVEEHPKSDKLALWVRFEADLNDLLRVNPEHALGRQYAAAAFGRPAPPVTLAEPPAGVPLWAFRQTELLGRVQRFVEWYVDHRQSAYGDFGGGISDDVDLTNLWPGVALMGAEPDKLQRSVRRLLEAAYANGMFTNGLPTIQADELHSYEEGINCLAQNLLLAYGSPRQLERAMETARGVAGITGVNAAGHRHIRTSYYSGTKQALEAPWNRAKPYSYLVIQPGQMLVEYNGSPAAKQSMLELADGLLAHRQPDGKGGYTLPTSIIFPTDEETRATRGVLPWHLFWGAWKWTGDRRYLDPILDPGTTGLMAVNANALDVAGLRATWGPRLLAGEQGRPLETRLNDGRGRDRASNYRYSGMDQFRWQLSGDKTRLEGLYAAQIQECALLEYINTEGSLWIDRVGAPSAELQRARLGGVALVRGALFPGHTVSWRFAAPATARSVGILIPDATPTAFKVIAYNLESAPVHSTLTGANVDPGVWEVTQGLDTRGTDEADAALETRTVPFERGESVELTLAPRATTVLTFKLKTPGTPYWSRPDLGIDPEDVVVDGREVRVTVHSLGSVNAPESDIVLRDAAGKELAAAKVPALAAPVDLQPKTAVVTLRLPEGADSRGGSVTLDPRRQLGEITTRNNSVRIP